MCDHHDGRLKTEFPSCMSRILASHGVYDPHTVINMIYHRVPFLIGTKGICDIECDWRFAKNGVAQAFDDDGVDNETEPLFVDYCNLTIKDEHMVEDVTVA